MTEAILAAARRAIGFMPEDEGLALYRLGLEAAPEGPLLEIGSYGGQSAIYLGAAARAGGNGAVQRRPPPWLGGEPAGPAVPRPAHRRRHDRAGRHPAVLPAGGRGAGLEEYVVAVVGRSETVARYWSRPLGLVFIDGGHSEAAAQADYDAWSPHVAPGGILAIHDVFPNPEDGGRPPHNIYLRALDSGVFTETLAVGSLRGLRRGPDARNQKALPSLRGTGISEI